VAFMQKDLGQVVLMGIILFKYEFELIYIGLFTTNSLFNNSLL